MSTNFQKLSERKTNEELLRSLKSQVENERKLLMEILRSLQEVEARKLHLEMGYPDLYTFAMKELNYSSGAAYRRISAMRLLESLPEAAPKLASGELGLENASQAQSFFRKENQRRKDQGITRLTLDEKREVVTDLLGKSTREGLRVLTERSPNVMIPAEKTRPLPEQKTLVQFVAGSTLMQKLDELKGLLAHQNYDGRMDVLIEKLADMALKKLKPSLDGAKTSKETEIPDLSETVSSPAQGVKMAEKMKIKVGLSKISGKISGINAETETKREEQSDKRGSAIRSRYISASERRKVLLRDRNGCTYKDPETGRVCQSRHGLQFDHLVPFSHGGQNSAQNLTLRCGAHNRFRAERMKLFRARHERHSRI